MPPGALLNVLVGHRATRNAVNRAFHVYAGRRTAALGRLDPVRTQERTLRDLVRSAASTRFGRDHGFAAIRGVADYQKAVPLRTYESLWDEYLRDKFPVFDDLTWPGRIPYLALTSGTTRGATKYIPVSHAMLASNEKAARSLIAYHIKNSRGFVAFPRSPLLSRRPSALERPAQESPSAI